MGLSWRNCCLQNLCAQDTGLIISPPKYCNSFHEDPWFRGIQTTQTIPYSGLANSTGESRHATRSEIALRLNIIFRYLDSARLLRYLIDMISFSFAALRSSIFLVSACDTFS